MNNISIILLTKNEADRISTWQKWLPKLSVVNELIVVDDLSTDNTLQKIKKLKLPKIKVKIFKRALKGDFSAQRQFALGKTTNDYVFWLDADEQPSNSLINYINHIDIHRYNNYVFKRQDIFLGKKLLHGDNTHQKFIRLFNRHHGQFIGQVHETWQSSSTTCQTNHLIIHTPHPNLKSFFNKLDIYSTLRSLELHQQGVRVGVFAIIFYPLGKFIRDYLILFGFLDGTPGIIMALGMSFHSFLVRAKLWHLSNP